MQKVWFITGISRGFGRAIAEAALRRGDVVVGTSRTGKTDIQDDTGNLHVLPLEVADQEKVIATITTAIKIGGRLDVIVNNAGYGLSGCIEATSLEEARHVLEVNFFGTVHIIQAALPFLRQQRSGHIVNISSVAGLAPSAGIGFYAAAKFAVEGMSLSLREEVAPLGIHVTLVEPGAFRTDFLKDSSVRYTARVIEDYDSTCGRARRFIARLAGTQPGDPQKGAAAIIAAVEASDPPIHLLLGADALRIARRRLETLSQQVKQWETLTLSTNLNASTQDL